MSSAPATLQPPPATPALPPGMVPWVTTEQVQALLKEEGTDRELIDGQLIEYPMSWRNYSHSRLTRRVGQLLGNWLDQQPEPRGDVLVGDAAFRLSRNPDTSVGVDVAYISPGQRAGVKLNAFALEGAPVLAVEVYSPSDQHARVMDKVERYLQAGAALVWLVDPQLRVVTVCRPDAPPELFNEREDLTAEPHLPGFRVPVAEIFA